MTSTLLASPWVPPDRTEMADPPNILFESSTITQVDNPDEFPQDMRAPRGSRLPDPAVGGKGASGKNRNGWTDGIIGLRQRKAAFTGHMWQAPAVKAEPIQGAVGQGKHANVLYGGVRQQMSGYDGSLSSNAQSFVGSVADK